jgi:hypothetical protein
MAGHGHQNKGPHGEPVEFLFEAPFGAKGTTISGNATIDFHNTKYQLDLEGRFIDAYLVELSYRNSDPAVINKQ